MINECYIRTYLVTVQNGITERTALGTHLVQTPSFKFNGRVTSMNLDGYTSLLELKEKNPPIGYFVPEKANVMERAYMLVRENARAPVVKAECPSETSGDFIADTGDTWLSYLADLIANQIYEDDATNGTRITQYVFDVDAMGNILFAPVQDVSLMQPVWTYTDDNSSILYPEISMEQDIYGIPNVVEVVYTGSTANTESGSKVDYHYVCVENHDPNSPISIEKRGRKIVSRITNPTFGGIPTHSMIEEYAVQLIKGLSKLQHTVTYTHGYCPVRPNDCVRLNYSRAGIVDVKAKVVSQSIKCTPGCPVTEKAIYTEDLLNPIHLMLRANGKDMTYQEWCDERANTLNQTGGGDANETVK